MSKLGELVELCHELNSEDFSVFFGYSGHVRGFGLSVDFGGWKGVDSDGEREPFGHGEGLERVDEAIDWLKQKHAENKLSLINRAQQAEQKAKALEEAKALLTPEQIKIIKELA